MDPTACKWDTSSSVVNAAVVDRKGSEGGRYL